MTVTELREALQALEAQGHGALRCVATVDWKDRSWLEEVGPEVDKIGKYEAEPDFPEGAPVVRLR